MAKYTAGQPVTSSTRASQPVRDNIDALHQMDFGALRVRAQSSPGLTVQVATDYDQAYINGQTPINYAGGSSGAITPPAATRISVLCISAAGALSWVDGDEDPANPAEPTIPANLMPLASVFCRSAMSSIKNTSDGTNGYILKDRRPFLNMGGTQKLNASTANTTLSSSVVDTAIYSHNVTGGVLGTDGLIEVTLVLTLFQLSGAGENCIFRLKYGGVTFCSATIANLSCTDMASQINVIITAHIRGDGTTSAQVGDLHIAPNRGSFSLTVGEPAAVGTGAVTSASMQALQIFAQFSKSSATDNLTAANGHSIRLA